MKIRLGELRKIIFEALEEAEGNAPKGALPYHDLEDDSLDVKLDNYFVDSEGGAAGAPAGDEAPKGSDIPEEEMKIDAAGFAREIAHLIENFTNLMDVKGVVLRRSLNYVGRKYGKEQSKTVQDVLETQFGVYSDEKEEPQAPGAANAGPALAG